MLTKDCVRPPASDILWPGPYVYGGGQLPPSDWPRCLSRHKAGTSCATTVTGHLIIWLIQ